MKTMQNYLEMDGGIILNIAMYNRFSSIGDSCYSEICGSFIEGVYEWVSQNVKSVDECSNSKYHGFTIYFEGGCIRRMYVPVWVMNTSPKDFKHAKSLFNKYVATDEKYNNSQVANQNLSFQY
jgi:hypothetical protein